MIIVKLRKWLPFESMKLTINILMGCVFVLYTCGVVTSQ